jgi:hypothetical protein
MSVLWAPHGAIEGPAARESELESDGGLALRLTQLDAQHRVIRETRSDPGSALRTAISGSCALLLIAADRSPGPVCGWTAATELAQLAPQALVGPGVLVRPQCPLRIAAGGVRGTRALGVASGRLLSEAARVETPAGTRPGWIETRFGEPPSLLRVTLRPRAGAHRGSGPYGAPVSVLLHDADGRRRLEARPEHAHSAGGLLQLSYRVPDLDWTGALTVRVQPDRDWYTDAVLGVAATATGEVEETGELGRGKPGAARVTVVAP